MLQIAEVFLIFIVTAAVFYDLRNYCIPNSLILLGYIFAFLLCLDEGIDGIRGFISGALLPIICLVFLQRAGIIGGGDVKLLSVAGGFLGTREGVYCIFFSFVIGAFLSLIVLLRRRSLKARICYFLNYIQTVVHTGHWIPYYQITRDGYTGTMHFSIAIMLAVWLVLWTN